MPEALAIEGSPRDRRGSPGSRVEPECDRDTAAQRRAEQDRAFMHEALRLARKGADAGEVPVGALVVMRNGTGEPTVIGSGFNRPIGASDPTAHAEIVALREAGAQSGNYRLTGADLFVTLEPCLMCLGAALLARIDRVVFGAADPRVGAVSRVLSLQESEARPNHRLAVTGGVEAEASAALLREFFAARRPLAGPRTVERGDRA